MSTSKYNEGFGGKRALGILLKIELCHVQYCQIDSIQQNNILFAVDRKIAFHQREVDKVLSIRSICQMEKFSIEISEP